MRRIHIINRCDICGIEQLLPDASEDELELTTALVTTVLTWDDREDEVLPPEYKRVPVIPLIDDDWIEWEGKDYCPDCALVHVAAPEYFPDTKKEAAL